MDEDSLGVRRPEFLIQTGLALPDGRVPYFLLRRLPLALLTLESCLDLGDSGMLPVYLRIGAWGLPFPCGIRTNLVHQSLFMGGQNHMRVPGMLFLQVTRLASNVDMIRLVSHCSF